MVDWEAALNGKSKKMLPENKENFEKVLKKLLKNYPFHADLLPDSFKD